MGIVLAAVFTIWYFHFQKSVRGKKPVQLQEVQFHIKEAASLKFTKKEIQIIDKQGSLLGIALTTSPDCDKIKGYAGPTDSLIVIDPQNKIVGVTLRSSRDTPGHVEDVKNDYEFIERWQNKDFLKIAEIEDLEENEIWSVSGATRTSECMAWGLIEKSRIYQSKSKGSQFRFSCKDIVVGAVLVLALLLTFTKIKENAKWRLILRWSIFILVVTFGMDLLCVALIGGWVQNGFPLYNALVLGVFTALMFVIPWTTRKQIYCQQICPHGLIQETMAQRIPSKFTWKLSKDLKWALKFLPGLLLVLSVIVLIFELPLDLSDVEVFAAWYPTRASKICISLFVLSLILSAFIPKGYCKYACPTGRFLEYLRTTGKADKFGFADKMAGLLLAIIIVMVLVADKIEGLLL